MTLMTRITRWLRPGGQLEHLRVTVYTRQDCCCCHKALDQLQAAQRRYRFPIDEVDVDTDPALAARYGTTVPVVAIDGKVRFRGAVNPVLLDRLLRAESRGPARAPEGH